MLAAKKSIVVDTSRPHHRITVERYGMPLRVYEGINRHTLDRFYKALSGVVNAQYSPLVNIHEDGIEVEW